MNPLSLFELEKKIRIEKLTEEKSIKKLSLEWLEATYNHKYCYNFTWFGIPIIQYPQDIMAMQEIIWQVKPDIIIETGIAHGGSILFYASMLSLLNNNGRVIGIDIDIRNHNKERLEAHPLFKNIIMIEGSSTEHVVVNQLKDLVRPHHKVLVALDSYHTHNHVLKELELYSSFVTKDSYLVVFDTFVERLSDKNFTDRPWSKNNNPHTAVEAFLKINNTFKVDASIHSKLLITANFNGYLQKIKD